MAGAVKHDQIIPFADLPGADLQVDAVYQSGRIGNAKDDPLPPLLKVDSQGGFRRLGSLNGNLDMLVLVSSLSDPDWPDVLDRETGVFTYYGDNKRPGRALHETGRHGNEILRRIFADAHNGPAGRRRVPPIFVFASTGSWRDLTFLGLAVPGSAGLTSLEDLVAVWHVTEGQRFQNYRARFTIVDASPVRRAWLNTIIERNPDDALAPDAWLAWRDRGLFSPLLARRSLEYRSRAEQLPDDAEGKAMIQAIRDYFRERPPAFEHCAAALVRMMIPEAGPLDVTRPSRDGGRDATGLMRIGSGPGAIAVEFAMEAKLYTPPNAVGVRDMSRLISRLRHRQFGVLVTTSCVDTQAYREIKEDRHPVIVIAAADMVALLRAGGRGSVSAVQEWLTVSFAEFL